MSQHSRNWIKFVALVAMAFGLGLFFAGLLDFPRSSLAQDRVSQTERTAIQPVEAPRIPSARPLADLSEAFSSVAEAVRPTVVYVSANRRITGNTPRPTIPEGLEPFFRPRELNPRGIETSSGSGFIVSSDGYILTNHHVIDGAEQVTVRLLDGRILEAQVVGSDKDTDVGVLKIEASGLRPAALGSSQSVRVGEWVLAIGNPLGDELTFSVTQGIVSAKGRGQLQLGQRNNSAEIQDYIQTDAAINRGNSGGPLLNVRGEVIGINTAIASATGFYAGYAFAVPIDLARAVMNQIITKGKVERTAMGVWVGTATGEDAEYLGLDSIAGVRIDAFLDESSPARRAGLEPGDVIVSVDGQPVGYVAQLQQMVGFRARGETVEVEAVRPDGRHKFKVQLTGTEDAEPEQSGPPRPAEVNPRADNALGIEVEALTPETARRTGVPGLTRGLLVRALGEYSPAVGRINSVESSIAPDIIVAVEGKPVRTEAEFEAALKAGGRNGVISLTVRNANSNGVARIVRVRLRDN